MKLFRLNVLFASLLMLWFANIASAQSLTGEFNNNKGWARGQTSSGFTLHGIDVSMEVQGSSIDGKLYYVVTFTNDTAATFNGGARISQNRPGNAFFAVSLKPGESKTWGEHLPAGLTTVYTLLRKDPAK
jgi:hypothetical protein